LKVTIKSNEKIKHQFPEGFQYTQQDTTGIAEPAVYVTSVNSAKHTDELVQLYINHIAKGIIIF